MNLKNMIIALIIALLYEILLKLSHILTPSMFNIPIVSGITSVLSFIVGVIIILFVFMFYIEERSNQQLEMVLKILIGCIVLHFILRLPITRNMIDYKLVRLSEQIIGLIQAILYFVLLIFYKREIPSDEKLLKHATVILTIIFGIGIIKSLYSLITFTRFIIAGIEVNFSPIFLNMMFILFLMTHTSIIYFLYRYWQFKSKVDQKY